MAVLLDAVTQVRQNIGEPIPFDGEDTDTMFTDGTIESWLLACNQLISRTSAMGWQAKAAVLATQVDIQEGNSVRKMSQAYAFAVAQVRYWQNQPENPLVAGQTRQGTNRRTMPW